jgi:hypothetical protein
MFTLSWKERQNIRGIAGGKAVRMIHLYSPILLGLLFICQIFYGNIDINVS